MLEKNHSVMGMRPKGETWEWYTKKFNLGSIHIYNKNTGHDDLWIFEIHLSSQKSFKPIYGYSSKEEAFNEGLKLYYRLLVQELERVQEYEQ